MRPPAPDRATSLLADLYERAQGRRLLVADENWPAADTPFAVSFAPSTLVVTNRVDVYRSLAPLPHPDVELSDFAFDMAAAGDIDAVFYRVSKEKPVVHHVINASARVLRDGGSLYLTGCKGDGTRTYCDRARPVFGDSPLDWKKARHGAYRGRLTKKAEAEAQLETQDYPTLRTIAELDEVSFCSKPGIFGWNKIDAGSALLIEALPRLISSCERAPGSVLDLGCGFGYLAVMAGRQLQIPVTATDNNVAAVAACERNLTANGIRGTVTLDDCGSQIDARFDLILCNPPFHQGFSSSGELTQRFVQSCHRLLAPGGAALFVVNQFVPLESVASAQFTDIERVGETGSFKLVRLRR